MRRQRQNKKKKLVIGLTGGFGSGKTTVAGIFKSYGAYVIDADRIAHSLLGPGKETYRKLIAKFGERILNKDRRVNRGELAKLVFKDERALRKLNKITHPVIIRIIKERIENKKSGIIVLDAPLLIEAGLKKMADRLIVVGLSRKNQLKRAMRKTGLKENLLLKIIRSQMPLSVKAGIADFVIDNNGTIANTRNQVRKIRRLLWKS